jgi:subtilisin family serine protease
MDTYLIKFNENEQQLILDKINHFGGEVVYSSPILPILGANLSDSMKAKLEDEFDLYYIHDLPQDGNLQNIDGSLLARQTNPVRIVPNLDFQDFKLANHIGWGINIAVIDSGISGPLVTEHHDFSGYGAVPNISHGTVVANVIKQAAPGAKILSFKVSHDFSVKYLNVLDAIHLAVTKADVINLSLGFNIEKCDASNPCTLCETINYYTQNQGKLFVVAAGNVGKENSIQCPGKSQEAVTVGSIKEQSLELADYSSRGVPGVKNPNIITSGSIYYNQEWDAGTSYSAPILSGVMSALLPSVNKNVTKLKSYVYNSAKDIGLPEHHQGFGLLDIDSLLEVLTIDQSNSKGKGQGQGN